MDCKLSRHIPVRTLRRTCSKCLAYGIALDECHAEENNYVNVKVCEVLISEVLWRRIYEGSPCSI